MIAKTNISRKTRHSVMLSDFKGVDYSASPYDVATYRASDADNMMHENGQLHKRKGFEEIYKISNERINGIYEYEENGHYLIVYAGTTFYIKNIALNTAFSQIIITSGIDMYFTNNKIQFFSGSDTKLFIIGCGKYLYFDIVNGTPKIDIVENIAYIPVTTENIPDECATSNNQTSNYSVNMLTHKRKNKFCCTETTVEGTIRPCIASGISSVLSDFPSIKFGETSIYYKRWELDGNFDYESEAFLNVSYYSGNTEKTQFFSTKIRPGNIQILYDDRYISSAIGSTDSERISNYLSGASSGFSAGLFLFFYLKYDSSNQKTYLYGAYPENRNLDFNTFSGEIEYSTSGNSFDGVHDNYNIIDTCRFGCTFGTGGIEELFLAGALPNVDFHSFNGDFTYFPDDDRHALYVGTTRGSISGYGRLSDGTLAIYKKAVHEPTIYYRTAQMYNTGEILEGSGVYDNELIFPTTAGNVGETLVNNNCSVDFAGDSLILSKNGVFGIELSNNIKTSDRYARERSRLIYPKFSNFDFENAHMFVHDNKLYLSFGTDCYIADAGTMCSVSTSVGASFNYEWWRWSNIPARIWATIDDKLVFGTSDGTICRFYEGYEDVTLYRTQLGEISHSNSSGAFVYDRDLKNLIYDGAIISFPRPIYCTMLNNVRVYNNKIIIPEDNKIQIYTGQNVYINGSVYSITDIDLIEGTFSLLPDGTAATFDDDTIINIYEIIYPEENVNICNVDAETQTFKLFRDRPLSVTVPENTSGYVNLTAAIYQKKSVKAYWRTPILDFGSNSNAKTLLQITICQEFGTSGRIKFGYETARSFVEVESIKSKAFNFNDISLDNLTFDTFGADSYTRKVNERNFNFIRFYFASDENSDCSINKISLIYKFNKQNKGVQ